MKTQKLDFSGLISGHYNYLYDLLPFHTDTMPFSKKLNVILSASNLKLHKTKVYHMPISIFFEFTNYCNLKCPVCATGSNQLERKPTNMKPELLEKVLPQINKTCLLISLWGWGESLLHPQLEDMMKMCYKYGIEQGMQVVVSTNGQNLSNVADILIKYPPTYIICTVDGLTEESFSIYRVGGKLQPLLDGVKYISKYRRNKSPQLHMRTVVMKQNEKDIPRINKFGIDNGFDSLSLRGLVKIVESQRFGELVPDNEKYQSYKYQDGNMVHNEKFFCRDSLMIPIVLANGDLCICCEDFNGDLQYGNLYEKSFKELWFGKVAKYVRDCPVLRPDKDPCKICPMTDRTRPITNLEFRDLT